MLEHEVITKISKIMQEPNPSHGFLGAVFQGLCISQMLTLMLPRGEDCENTWGVEVKEMRQDRWKGMGCV